MMTESLLLDHMIPPSGTVYIGMGEGVMVRVHDEGVMIEGVTVEGWVTVQE